MKNIKLTTITLTMLMAFALLSACSKREELPEGAVIITETDVSINVTVQTEDKGEMEIPESLVTNEDVTVATNETSGTTNGSSTVTTSGNTSGTTTGTSATQPTIPTNNNPEGTSVTTAPASETVAGVTNTPTLKPTDTPVKSTEPTATTAPKPTATPTPEPTSTPTPTPSGVIDMSNAEKADPNEQFYVLVGIDVEIWFEIDPDDDGVYEWTSEILHFDTPEYKKPKSQDCVAKLEEMGYTVVGVGNIKIVKSYSEPA